MTDEPQYHMDTSGMKLVSMPTPEMVAVPAFGPNGERLPDVLIPKSLLDGAELPSDDQ
jgi:hypothetical protein